MVLLWIFLVFLRVGLIHGGNFYYLSCDTGSTNDKVGGIWVVQCQFCQADQYIELIANIRNNRKPESTQKS